MTPTNQLFLNNHMDSYIQILASCLRFPSISTLPEHANDILDCAEHVKQCMTNVGLSNVRTVNTTGAPILYGERITNASKPTLLIYGHYDVQPIDPLDEWVSPPFEPTIRNGAIYARGASDNKGMFMAYLCAIDAYLKTHTALPVNIKVIIEGEEEIGSPALFEWLNTHKPTIKNDAIVVSDTPMFSNNQPSVCTSLRGLTYLDIHISSIQDDVHSGQLGGGVPNIIHYVASMIASMKDPATNEVLIPGFYDDVIEFPPFDAAQPAAKKHLTALNSHYRLGGHANPSFYENIWYRPTLDCNGIDSGFSGEGAKTVIPSKLVLKCSCRLVPNQSPSVISALVNQHIESHLPDTFTVTTQVLNNANPLRVEATNPYVHAALSALKTAHNIQPIIQGEGGSIPILEAFQHACSTPIVLIGMNTPNDNIHAPNERFKLDHFKKGIATIMEFFDEITKNTSV